MNEMTETRSSHTLVPAFIASVIHRNLKSLSSIKSVVELNLNLILSDLNNLVKTYNTEFGYRPSNAITKDVLNTAIRETPFHKFITVQDDLLKIQTAPDVYQTSMSDAIVSSTWTQSQTIIKTSNDLAQAYRTALREEEHTSTQHDQAASSTKGTSEAINNSDEENDSSGSPRLQSPKQPDATVDLEVPEAPETPSASRVDKTATSPTEPLHETSSTENPAPTQLPQDGAKDQDEKMVIDDAEPTLDSIRPTNNNDEVQAESPTTPEPTDKSSHPSKPQPVDEVKKSDKELEEPSPEVEVEPIEEIENTGIPVSENATAAEDDVTAKTSKAHSKVEEDTGITDDAKISAHASETNTPEIKDEPEDAKTDESDDESDDDIDSDSEDEDGHILELKRSQRQRQAVHKRETSSATPVKRGTSENSPASSRKRSLSPSIGNPQQRKRFQHIAVNLINSIQAHRYSSPFLHPVNKKEALDYEDIIYQPKDLKNILKSLKSKQDPPEYQSIKQLERDVMLMFANCIMYNRSDTDLVELTKSMRNDVKATFKIFEDAASDI